MKVYRDQGAVGAVLDEYEKAIEELVDVISSVSQAELITIVDDKTKDEDCRSIQTVLTHVVQSGYTYIVEIRRWISDDESYKEKEFFDEIDSYVRALKEMFHYTIDFFEAYPDVDMYETDPSKQIHVRWGQRYDVEQLMEHAIVHVLRHRRQIERFKLLL